MKPLYKTSLKLVLVGMLLGGMSGCGKKTTDEYIQQAKQYVSENDTNAAVLFLKNAIQEDPKSAQARFELGQIYLQQKQ